MCITIYAVGDISLRCEGDPFAKVQHLWKDKDILIGNLETVLTNRPPTVEKSYTSITLPERISFLKKASFDSVNIANNHIIDAGVDGFLDTIKTLKKAKIGYFGGGTLKEEGTWKTEIKGLKVTLVGYNQYNFPPKKSGIFLKNIKQENILDEIRQYSKECDILIVSLHWGIEKVFYPSPEQISLSHQIIDAGAYLVLGHHPHVIQGIERYKKGLIAYSLGNFQFEHKGVNNTEKTDETFLLRVTISSKGINTYQIIPLCIDDGFVPFPDPKRSEKIKGFLHKISLPIKEKKIDEKWWFEEIGEKYLKENLTSWKKRIKQYGFSHLLKAGRWCLSSFPRKCFLGVVRRHLKYLKQVIPSLLNKS